MQIKLKHIFTRVGMRCTEINRHSFVKHGQGTRIVFLPFFALSAVGFNSVGYFAVIQLPMFDSARKNLPENGQNTASACPNYSNRTAHRGGQCENIIIACVNFFHAFNAAKTCLPCLCLVAGTLRSSAALRRNNNPAIRLFALAVGGNIGVVLQSGMQNPALIGIHGFKSPRPAR